MTLKPRLYFRYLSKLYLRNLIAVLLGLAFAFAAIDYFQHAQNLNVSWNYKILYIFYMWEQALGLLYPLAIVFAVIMTKLALVKQNTMGILHAFGYGKRRLLKPFLLWSGITYLIFVWLNTTEFAYAKDRGASLLRYEMGMYDVNNIFFKYNDTFVYMEKLDPVNKVIYGVTIFKVKNNKVHYTIHASKAIFDGEKWDARDAELKTHIYDKKGVLQRYDVQHKLSIKTLYGYKPKIIESLYEGKVLNLVDAYRTWKLLRSQGLDTDKIRAAFYEKVVAPLFALALVIILFLKIPFHARMMHFGVVVTFSLGITFAVWGILFGLNQIGYNGVVMPEFTTVLPIGILWLYALYLYIAD